MKNGVLSDREIKKMVLCGHIESVEHVHIQPSSVDLSLSEEVYELKCSFLPGRGKKIRDVLSDMGDNVCSLSPLGNGFVLLPGRVYLARIREQLRLPEGILGRANPKSSTGRIDTFVRLLCDGAMCFDEIVDGYNGEVWLEISPLTFPIRVRSGSRLAQVRFSIGSLEVEDVVLRRMLAENSYEESMIVKDGILFSIDLSRDVVGWKAKKSCPVIDVDEVCCLSVDDFWSPVFKDKIGRRDGVILDPGEFYILSSVENIVVPPWLAAEMKPYDAGIGEFRAHYAGFFDPGFGIEKKSRGVLEVRVHDVPFFMEHGQVAGYLKYEMMSESPERVYGKDMNSNYSGQELRLSKHFKIE